MPDAVVSGRKAAVIEVGDTGTAPSTTNLGTSEPVCSAAPPYCVALPSVQLLMLRGQLQTLLHIV